MIRQLNRMVLLVLMLLYASCSKDKLVSDKTMLLSRTWYLEELSATSGSRTAIAYQKNGNVTNVQDLSYVRLTFKTDGIIQSNFVNSQSGILTPNARWRFLKDETQIQITDGNLIFVYNVVSLNDKLLEYSEEILTPQGVSVIANYKYAPL